MQKTDFKIKEIDLSNSTLRNNAEELIHKTFGQPTNNLKLNTFTESSIGNKTIYIGSFDNEKLIGFNAFISHDFILNGEIKRCFQSCWSASDANYRGKKVWVNIINFAKEYLKEKGGSFIFGFPNHNSHPIFIHKLGFNELEMIKTFVPSIQFLNYFYFKSNKYNLNTFNTYLQNDHQILQLKKTEKKEKIIELNLDNNLIWGIIRQKNIAGIKLPYLDVGGMVINRSKTIKYLFKKLFETHFLVGAQIVMHKNNPYHELFKKTTKAPLSEPFIYFDLNDTIDSNTNIHIMSGVKDVF